MGRLLLGGTAAPARRGLQPAPALALTALALSVLALACVAVASDSARTCLTHGEEARANGVVVHTVAVHLLWESAPAHAAAALLRAVLLGAGYQPDTVTLQHTTTSRDLCTLLNDSLKRYGEEKVVVAVAVAWSAPQQPHNDSSEWCNWTGRWLEVLGAGAAPLAPRLHARHAPGATRALALPGCRLPDGTDDETEENATVYIPAGEWKNDTEELCTRMRCRQLARHQLASLVAAANRSFLFFDAELWHNVSGVSVLPAAPAPRPPPASLLVGARSALLERAPGLYKVLHRPFAPRERDLRAVLEHAARAPAGDVEAAACSLAPAAHGYNGWAALAAESSYREAVVLHCDSEPRDDYKLAVDIIAQSHLEYITNLYKLQAWFATRLVSVDCGDPSALALEIDKWRSNGQLWRTVGVAAPAEQASLAALNAQSARLVLVAYTPHAAAAGAGDVRSATGDPESLARALRRLLAGCGWKRLGLVSQNTPLARAVKDELLRAGDLNAYEATATTPNETVSELRALDTRVFFVNADNAMTRDVLQAAALAAQPGDADRHVWLVRDYEAPDAAVAALRPLSVSFQWRGTDDGELRLRWPQSAQWRGRSWPRHAAAVVDALVTLGEGFERLVTQHNETLDHPQMKEKLRYFWEGVRERSVSGVVGDLTYDGRGVVDARVYIERWGSDMRLRRLATWRPRDNPPPGELCPATDVPYDDGSTGCLTPFGARFHPSCLDVAWISGSVAFAVMLVALWLAAVAVRRWLARRDRLLERATTARILAQREATFSELAPYLVESAALELGEELGAGRFGIVRRGEVRSARCRPTGRAVAVKALREGASPAEESQFLREARLLAALQHEHVVRFEGVCWEGGPPLLLMELALFGDLLQYLRARRYLAEGAPASHVQPEEAAAVSGEALTRLACEAAEALAYLGARGLVHRDVRAANCLVDANRSLKLADFGLARETGAADGEYACRGRALFPVLWMAPESLARGVATAASDAWSFGVLALELVTLGARPFGGATPEAAVRVVLGGGRPPLPRDACAETRALALACWRREPAARPPAARLAAWLARRQSALRPALASDLEEPDCDSGIGEPEPLPHADRSLDLLTIVT